VYAVDRVQAPEDVERALSSLGALIVPRTLRFRSREVEIIADGKLASAPFAAMLSDVHSVSLISSMYGTARTPPGSREWRLVAIGADSASAPQSALSPVFPALPSASNEGDAVAAIVADAGKRIELLKGADVSVRAFGAAWRHGADIMHVATHGLADLRQPLGSLLAFPADEHGTPTYLTAGQIQLWSGDVGLVYLSACETAQGPERFAAGMPGLQQAFLHAGARQVIATLWAVEDRFAREFALDFYGRLQSGMTAQQSLATTQREWLTAPGGWRGQEGRRRVTAAAYSIYSE
jgi:CHAT domain-containing protein